MFFSVVFKNICLKKTIVSFWTTPSLSKTAVRSKYNAYLHLVLGANLGNKRIEECRKESKECRKEWKECRKEGKECRKESKECREEWKECRKEWKESRKVSEGCRKIKGERQDLSGIYIMQITSL